MPVTIVHGLRQCLGVCLLITAITMWCGCEDVDDSSPSSPGQNGSSTPEAGPPAVERPRISWEVKVVVRDYEHRPLAGVTVIMYITEGGRTYQTTGWTNEAGEIWFFERIDPDSAVVFKADKAGYESQTQPCPIGQPIVYFYLR